MADTSAYPGALDGDLRALVAPGTTPSGFEDFAQLVADAVAKVEAELGTNPSGAAATVAARLTADEGGLATHLADGTDAHDASAISFVPAGTIAATTVQAAVEEVASEYAAADTAHAADTTAVHGIADTAALVLTSDARLSDARTPTGAAGGVLSGTFPNPGFAVDMATQAELDAAVAAEVARADGAYAPQSDLGVLASGEGSMPRRFATAANIPTGSGSLRLAYFTARKTEAITKLALFTGTTAAGATPTLVRAGVWAVDADGALTSLVASIANDTSLLGAASTEYERNLLATWNKVAGTRYAAGVLVVSAAAAPTVVGSTPGAIPAVSVRAPRLSSVVTGQTDLPASVAIGSIVGSSNAPFVEFRP